MWILPMNYWLFLLIICKSGDWKKDFHVRLSQNLVEFPPPTIAKFEQKHTISLSSYVALAKALGYTKAIKELLSEPIYNTMEELEMINKNRNRKKGRNEISK